MKIKKAAKLKYNKIKKVKKIDTPSVTFAKKEVKKAAKKYADAKIVLKDAQKKEKK